MTPTAAIGVIACLYESTVAPRPHLYTTVGGTAKDYVASSNFSIPVRNYFYDITVQLLKPSSSVAALSRATHDQAQSDPEISVRYTVPEL
ncbi:hypothetical protein FACS1894159_04700 [Bacteroidia bacterium]|nr:hypothetical protein FACS1894159_04700 [Bacteroidia bacterium]